MLGVWITVKYIHVTYNYHALNQLIPIFYILERMKMKSFQNRYLYRKSLLIICSKTLPKNGRDWDLDS